MTLAEYLGDYFGVITGKPPCEADRASSRSCPTALPDRADLWCQPCRDWVTWKHLTWVQRIQAEYGGDLAERRGDLYEQIKDLIEQFRVEREEHAANTLDVSRCRQILATDATGEGEMPTPSEPLPVESVAFCLYDVIQELRWRRKADGWTGPVVFPLAKRRTP